MAHPIIHNSKHILKRVGVGVATGVVGFLAIYFLGFNKGPSRPSEAELRDNTINAWKKYVAAETAMAAQRDSNFRKMSRLAISTKEYKVADSLIRADFLQQLTSLAKAKATDKLFYLLIDTRIRYTQSAWEDFNHHFDRFQALKDSVGVDSTIKNLLIQALNTTFTNKNNNFSERLGHTIEDISFALARRYNYPFSITDLTAFNFYYQNIKRMARAEKVDLIRMDPPAPEGPAPSATN